MAVWPSYGNDDEGTYMSRAWAVQTGLGAHHGPAPYTYWYDHPPFGWIQLALWTWVTHTFQAGTVAVASGRADMLLYTLVTAVLVYTIARRLGCSVVIATGATLLFGLSPLSVENMRMVMLDTIGLPWVLGAFALALSSRPKLWTFAASGLCFAAGVLSKETYLVLLPALLWLVWQRAVGPTRRMCLTVFSAVTAGALLFYPLYAVLKGELFPGRGHVSLIGAIAWQLFGRPGSGSVFHVGTDAHNQVLGWLHVDPWLLGLGAASLPVTFFVRRLRPMGAALALLLVMLLRTGYLPAAYITGVLPFAAIAVAGATDAVWRSDPALHFRRMRSAVRRLWQGQPHSDGSAFRRGLFSRTLVAGFAVAISVIVIPQWASADHAAMTTDTTRPFRQAEAWITQHVPRSATFLCDDDVWIDLVDDGYEPDKVIWAWELDDDPEVRARFPLGWRQVDYIVATQVLLGDLDAPVNHLRQASQALAHSTVVAQFGPASNRVSIRKVEPSGESLSDTVPTPLVAKAYLPGNLGIVQGLPVPVTFSVLDTNSQPIPVALISAADLSVSFNGGPYERATYVAAAKVFVSLVPTSRTLAPGSYPLTITSNSPSVPINPITVTVKINS
jgi:hypothetical protein